MNMRSGHAVLLIVAAAAAAGFAFQTLLAPLPALAQQGAPARNNLANLKGLRVILVLRDDWMNPASSQAGNLPAVNSLYLAKSKLYCRIDDVHNDWVEVSTPRSTDPQANPISTRDIWLIRTDAIIAIQTAQADR